MSLAGIWRSIDDFSDDDISWILRRSSLHRGSAAASLLNDPPVVGLLFLETSLRTRIGFAAAAAKIGGQSLDVVEQRHSAIATPESLADTFRVLSGYCDAVVARLDQPLDDALFHDGVGCPVLNGGDRGNDQEHPSQVLVDLFAFATEGRLWPGSMLFVGDLRMRAARSWFRLLERHPSTRVSLLTSPPLLEGHTLAPHLPVRLNWTEVFDDAPEVVYLVGIPHKSVSEPERARLRVTESVLRQLPATTVVTSPLPLVDEITPDARQDSRFRAFQHSDNGIFLRMDILEFLLRSSR